MMHHPVTTEAKSRQKAFVLVHRGGTEIQPMKRLTPLKDDEEEEE